MGQYRKRPVIIDAWQVQWLLDSARNNSPLFPAGVEAAHLAGDLTLRDDCISVLTLEGTMVARADDWLLRGVAGEFYPCKPDIFAATYEEV